MSDVYQSLASYADATINGDKGEVGTIVAGRTPSLPSMSCSP
jgi:hypothetical protein